MTMSDRYEEVLKHYPLQVKSVRKGRGSWICETDQGPKCLREYRGTRKRLEFEDQVLASLKGIRGLTADQYVRNEEGDLLTAAEDGVRFILKDWFGERECSMKDGREVCRAVRNIAVLHQHLRMVPFKEEWAMGSTMPAGAGEGLKRRNRELKRARTYIRGKRKKSEFELAVIESFSGIFDQAAEAAQELSGLWETGEEPYFLCHGDLDQHHVLMGENFVAVVEYNRLHLGLQMEDLYRFMRKAMEKHGWNQKIGMEMLEAYQRVLPLEEKERRCLYYLFLYPEKYWKQINYYFNANKAWIPARNIDKIQSLRQQEPARQSFLSVLSAW